MKKLLIIGTNDIATAIAIRLFRAGFSICMVSMDIPFDLYSQRNYSTVLKNGSKTIENIKAVSYADFIFHGAQSTQYSINKFADFILQDRQIAVLNKKDIKALDLNGFEYCINCDDNLFTNLDVRLHMPVISCVSESESQAEYSIITHGKYIGRVNYPFLGFNEEGIITNTFLVTSPVEGVFIAEKSIGDKVIENERIATVGGTDVYSDFSGYVWGAVSSGLIVAKNTEIFSLSLEKQKEDIFELPSKVFSIAGGVLEAILFHANLDSI